MSDLQQKLGGEQAGLRASVSAVNSEIARILSGSGEPSPNAMGLEEANRGVASALRVVESGDRAVPSQAIVLYRESSQAMKLRVGQWNQCKAGRLKQLNQQLQRAKVAPLAIAEAGKGTE